MISKRERKEKKEIQDENFMHLGQSYIENGKDRQKEEENVLGNGD